MSENRAKRLQAFVKENLPDVSQMRRQLDDEECEKLFEFASPQEIHDVLLAMENQMGIEKKYKSVYLTARNWIKIQRQRSKGKATGSNSVSSGLFTYDEAMSYLQRKNLSLDIKKHFHMLPNPDGGNPVWRLK